MEALSTNLTAFWPWLLKATLQGSLLVCLIVLIKMILRERLPARWHYALWLVLLLRLALPWTPQSRISVYSLIPLTATSHPVMLGMEGTNRTQDAIAKRDLSGQGDPAGPSEGAGPAKTPQAAKDMTAESSPTELSVGKGASSNGASSGLWLKAGRVVRFIPGLLPWLWLAGAMVLAGYILIRSFRLWQAIRSERPVTDRRILDLLEDCKMQMRIQTIVAVVVTDKIRTPVLFGFLRPRILLPQGLVEAIGMDDLEYVFLHELAHLKRHDITMGWVVSLVQVLHWFNPLVWLAFGRMRMDQETAADALALSKLTAGEPTRYGRTIMRLLEGFSQRQVLPSVAGILEDTSHIERRIHMIAKFENSSSRWSPLSVVLIISVACLTLPDARQEAAMATEGQAKQTAAAKPLQQPTFRMIKIANQISWDAQWSPDGKNIAYVSKGKFWIMPRFGNLGPDYPGSPNLLDTGEVNVEWHGFSWSRDGQWIAFNNMKEEPKGQGRMCVVSIEGGKPKEVYENYRDARIVNYRISLSPNGKTLAFSSVDQNELHIYTISVDGGLPKRLVDAPAREPVFSPDGKMIAYVADKNLGRGGGGLWVVPADGGTSRLVADAGNASSPLWSPDGRMIAFLDDKEGKQIYVIPMGEDRMPVGEKIAIDCPEGIARVARLTGWNSDNKIGAVFQGRQEVGIYTLPVKGGKATLIARGGNPLQPRWSPDGKRIIHTNALKEDRSGWVDNETASVSAEGGEVITIPIRSDAMIRKPSWGAGNNVSPDGKRIVFSGQKAGEAEARYISHIWTLPIGGGKPRQLTNAPSPITDYFPCWSPDGKAIAFIRARTSENMAQLFTDTNIYIIQADGGEPRPLTSESDMVAFGSIVWSPDGKWLAYLSADKERSDDSMRLKVYPAEGGKPCVVGKIQAIHVNIEMAWSPDSKRIAFNGPDKKIIQIMSLDDGSIVDVEPDLVNSAIYHLDWSRNGDRLVFCGSQGGSDPEFWVLENFLPTGAGAKDSK